MVIEGAPGWVPDPNTSLPRGHKRKDKPGSGKGWTKGKEVWERCLSGMGVWMRWWLGVAVGTGLSEALGYSCSRQ